jgi:hypothetical protein
MKSTPECISSARIIAQAVIRSFRMVPWSISPTVAWEACAQCKIANPPPPPLAPVCHRPWWSRGSRGVP